MNPIRAALLIASLAIVLGALSWVPMLLWWEEIAVSFDAALHFWLSLLLVALAVIAYVWVRTRSLQALGVWPYLVALPVISVCWLLSFFLAGLQLDALGLLG